MAEHDPATTEPKGDPWHAFGYLVAGVAVYGLIGWAVDRWLGTSFGVAIGILIGAGLGLYLTWARFNRRPPVSNSDEQDSGESVRRA